MLLLLHGCDISISPSLKIVSFRFATWRGTPVLGFSHVFSEFPSLYYWFSQLNEISAVSPEEGARMRTTQRVQCQGSDKAYNARGSLLTEELSYNYTYLCIYTYISTYLSILFPCARKYMHVYYSQSTFILILPDSQQFRKIRKFLAFYVAESVLRANGAI